MTGESQAGGNAASGGLLASDGSGAVGGVNVGGGSSTGVGATRGSGGTGNGVTGNGGVSDTASLGSSAGPLTFDGAGNIVSGVQSAFGDVPSTYTGKQVILAPWPIKRRARSVCLQLVEA